MLRVVSFANKEVSLFHGGMFHDSWRSVQASSHLSFSHSPIQMYTWTGDNCCNHMSMGAIKTMIEEELGENAYVVSLMIGKSAQEDTTAGVCGYFTEERVLLFRITIRWPVRFLGFALYCKKKTSNRYKQYCCLALCNSSQCHQNCLFRFRATPEEI